LNQRKTQAVAGPLRSTQSSQNERISDGKQAVRSLRLSLAILSQTVATDAGLLNQQATKLTFERCRENKNAALI
jgi:hypothetical protein